MDSESLLSAPSTRGISGGGARPPQPTAPPKKKRPRAPPTGRVPPPRPTAPPTGSVPPHRPTPTLSGRVPPHRPAPTLSGQGPSSQRQPLLPGTAPPGLFPPTRPTAPAPTYSMNHQELSSSTLPHCLPNDVLFPPPCDPQTSSFRQPDGASAAWDARSYASSPELGYDDDFSYTPMPLLDWTLDSSTYANDLTQPLTNLLTQDDLQLSMPPASTPSRCGKGGPKRGINYTNAEDIQLCISWMNISNDDIIGDDQPAKAYWERIAEDFHRNKDFESERTANSLEHRCSTIIRECMKFHGYYEEIERLRPSGVPYQEHMLGAQARYAGASNGKSCPFIHCWLKIRYSEKFSTLLNSKKLARTRELNLNLPAASQQANDGQQDVGQGQESSSVPPDKKPRPLGRKQAKEKLKRSEGDDDFKDMMQNFVAMKAEANALRKETWSKEVQADEEARKKKELEDSHRLQLEERKLEIERQRLQWEQEREIMFCDVSKMDTNQRAYVMTKRAEIAKASLFNASVGESGGGASVGESACAGFSSV